MDTFGNRIRKLRKDRKLSQVALAELVGVSDVTIGLWEKGDTTPTTKPLHLLSAALGVTMEYLVTGQGEARESIDRDLLIQSIRDVEEAAQALKLSPTPELKATLIYQRYQLGGSPSFADIIGLF